MGPEVIVLIGGMGVFGPVAHLYYGLMAWMIGAKVVALPHAGFRRLDRGYGRLEPQLDRIIAGRRAVIIGHSEGGIMALLYARRHSNVLQVVAISAPIHGSFICHWLFGFVMPATRDMAPGSGFSRNLVEDLEKWLAGEVKPIIHCVYGVLDGVVWPANSSKVPGALNHVFVLAGAEQLNATAKAGMHYLEGALNHFTGPLDLGLISLVKELVHHHEASTATAAA